MPETRDELAADSRWPSFFPSPICFVTTTDGRDTALEKVVGASIVNRFPYVIALSFCKESLSSRHHVRAVFSEMLERGGTVAVQYLPPGELLDRAMHTIATVPEDQSNARLARTGLPVRRGVTNTCPVFADAYMVYEAKLVQPGKDFEGQPIYETAWVDVGSHRVYFLEITAIQLRQDIAEGRSQIHWRSLPTWTPRNQLGAASGPGDQVSGGGRYIKGYTPNYAFPSGGTIAFETDSIQDGMAIKHLPPLPEDQVEVDNDRARWPCFFPSSAGLITSWSDDQRPNLMPCGSTTILSRHPLVIAPCVSYAAINERYAPRASLDILRKRGRFGCGVPYIHEQIVSAMKYAGTTSISLDPDKVANAGLEVLPEEWAPVLASAPLHYDCEIVGEVRLGTAHHVPGRGPSHLAAGRRVTGQPARMVSVGVGRPDFRSIDLSVDRAARTASRRVPDRRRPGALLQRARQGWVAARREALAHRLRTRAVDAARIAGPLRPAARRHLQHAHVPERRHGRIELRIAPDVAQRGGAPVADGAGPQVEGGARRRAAGDVPHALLRLAVGPEPALHDLEALERGALLVRIAQRRTRRTSARRRRPAAAGRSPSAHRRRSRAPPGRAPRRARPGIPTRRRSGRSSAGRSCHRPRAAAWPRRARRGSSPPPTAPPDLRD